MYNFNLLKFLIIYKRIEHEISTLLILITIFNSSSLNTFNKSYILND